MSNLTAFLQARYTEDERIALAAADPGGPHWPDADSEMWSNQLLHARRHDPARVLREVEAKRRILDQCELALSFEHPIPHGKVGDAALASMTVVFLALPYVDHPDYRKEWRP